MPHHTRSHELSPLDHDDLARVLGGLYEETYDASYDETAYDIESKADIPPKTLRVAFFSCTYYNPYGSYYVVP